MLADPADARGSRNYGNWPTIPQLYINGEVGRGSRHRPADVRKRRAGPEALKAAAPPGCEPRRGVAASSGPARALPAASRPAAPVRRPARRCSRP
ncbi:MAG: hypothetical protein R3F43_27845 [bacterium]